MEVSHTERAAREIVRRAQQWRHLQLFFLSREGRRLARAIDDYEMLVALGVDKCGCANSGEGKP